MFIFLKKGLINMDSIYQIKKLYLDKDYKPVIQFNSNGTVILYNSDEGAKKIELTYHHFMR